ncbi:ribosome silencing factor [Rhodoferax sp. AJA081-3]|uniref:ribosome silencing factor n=1 Tax=Rhodoferax sp. AJA081-3 TaxID=2752316 RepID=UPI001AE00165|nr:ribosome silencing factor [Rhodoferax sp. AJA081-3]QTN28959.1 ribosome silencing factor [Rhodoferax sp. AJA081-3]
MNTSTVAKKDITKLQRAIVDGLEDVKAQDIQVFDTEHLSSLFERVIVASGTSNRQTKGLAASVRDAVREAGFAKPRIEGEDNGEWIIVDCGQAVVHIMQPTFRTYYNLEELWGEKPVRLKLGSAKPAMAESAKPAAKAAPKVEPTLRRSNAAKKGVAEAFPSKAQLKKDADKAAKAPARKTSAKPAPAGAAAPAKKVAAKKVPVSAKRTVVGKPAAKPAAKKVAAKKTAPRKA